MNRVKGLKLIGKGTFTRVYKETEATVLIVSTCHYKEAVALGWFPDSPLFPKLEKLDYLESGAGLYRGKLLAKVKAPKSQLNESDYRIYRQLRDIHKRLSTGYDALFKAFEAIKDPDLKYTMLSALDACTNYGEAVGFEISPRNILLDNGRLVLADCFFNVDLLRTTNQSRKTKRGY